MSFRIQTTRQIEWDDGGFQRPTVLLISPYPDAPSTQVVLDGMATDMLLNVTLVEPLAKLSGMRIAATLCWYWAPHGNRELAWWLSEVQTRIINMNIDAFHQQMYPEMHS